MSRYTNIFSRKVTPQSQPIPGSAQLPNNAGGYAWAVDDWVRLDRFLVLGSEGGTYYVSEQKLGRQNAEAVVRCVKSDGERTVKRIVEISQSGRAPKQAPALFALALCAAEGDEATRKAALDALPWVARTGTHLFEFAEYVQALRGWGRGLRKAVARWYEDRRARDLAYQAVKYQQREGWSHRDLLRLAHVKSADEQRNAIYYWITRGWPGVGEEPHPDEVLRLIWAFEKAKVAKSAGEVAGLVREYRLPRECVPTQWLTEAGVWDALLRDMPVTAMLRNLGTMSKVGLITPGSEAERLVVEVLSDHERLRRARVHPIALLSALMVYQQGHGERSKAHWTPDASVIDALDAAFYDSFSLVVPAGKRYLLGLDVSGSMSGGAIAGVPGLTPRVASAAMALVTAATERRSSFMAFATKPTALAISPRQRLDDVVKTVSGLAFGGTDCALPMLWALEQKLEVDTFVVYTDSETWFGAIHPAQALRQYRERTGIPAKLVVVGMTSTQFSIADPGDAGMLDVVGFDTASPALIADFARQ